MLMKIALPKMGELLVMTAVTISPSQREVSLPKQLCRSPRLVSASCPYFVLSRPDAAVSRRNQSRAPVELFCQGNFRPGGGNHHHRHHQRSSHRRGLISINNFTSTISSQNPSSSLVSNLVSKPQIGTCGLLVVLITPCS